MLDIWKKATNFLAFISITLQIPNSHYEKKNTQNEQRIAHFEYFFTCHCSKTVWLADNISEIKIFSYQAKKVSF